MTVEDLADRLDAAAHLLTITARFLTELSKEIER